MKNIKSCEFNMDTGCLELRFANGDPEAYLNAVTACAEI